jgi:hypothetical protein
MILRTRWFACIALLGALTGGVAAPGAAASTSEDPVPGTYSGEYELTFTFAGGGTDVYTEPAAYDVTCADGACTLHYVDTNFDERLLPVSGQPTVTEIPQIGELCNLYDPQYAYENGTGPAEGEPGYFRFGLTITTQFIDDTLVVTEDGPDLQTIECTYDSGVETTNSPGFSQRFVGILQPTESTDTPGRPSGGVAPSYWIPTSAPLTADAPSVLSGMPTIAEAITPLRVGVAVTGAIVLALLMAFPSRLLSGARDRLVERFKQWRRKRRAERSAAAGKPAPVEKATRVRKPYEGWLLAIAGLLVASVIAVFVDPRAGFDGGTLRLLGSVFVAFLAEVALGWFVLIFVVRRTNPGTTAWFTFKPWLLLAVVGAVVFARLTGLQPGIAFGAVAAVAFAAIVNDRDRARFTFVGLAYAFGLAIVAWVGYSLLAGAADANLDAGLLFVHESLAAATVAGISLLPLLLIPVRGMPGFEIYGWNRVVWGASYLVGLIAFLLVLLPMPTSWKEVAISLWAWLGLFVLYAVAATVVWLAVTKPWKPQPTTATPEKVVEKG